MEKEEFIRDAHALIHMAIRYKESSNEDFVAFGNKIEQLQLIPLSFLYHEMKKEQSDN